MQSYGVYVLKRFAQFLRIQSSARARDDEGDQALPARPAFRGGDSSCQDRRNGSKHFLNLFQLDAMSPDRMPRVGMRVT